MSFNKNKTESFSTRLMLPLRNFVLEMFFKFHSLQAIKEAEKLKSQMPTCGTIDSNVPSTAVSSSSVVNGINTSPIWTSPPLPNASVSSSGNNHCNRSMSVDVPPESIHLSNGEVLSKPLNEKFLKEPSRNRLINCDGALSPALSTSSVSFSPERSKQLTNGPIQSSPPADSSTPPHHKPHCNNLVNDKTGVKEKFNCVSETSQVTFSADKLSTATVQSPLMNHMYDGHNGPLSSIIPPTTVGKDSKPNEMVSNPGPKVASPIHSCNGMQSPKPKLSDPSCIPGRGLPPLLMSTGISEDHPARDVITMCRYLGSLVLDII